LKFKCINNQEQRVFSSKLKTIPGLTVGKVYLGNIGFWGTTGEPAIAIFNDDGEWDIYRTKTKIKLFEPVSE